MRISDIRPYGRNARNNAAAVPKVAESIREFGEATTREITTSSYKAQQKRLDKELFARLGR